MPSCGVPFTWAQLAILIAAIALTLTPFTIMSYLTWREVKPHAPQRNP